MNELKPTQRIFDIVKAIKDDKYRLPSIQRSFVWEEERMCKLMDSIMSEYPIGSFLFWKPPTELKIRTRKFVETYKTGDRIISEEDPSQSSPHLVLDGQQRLQSLYLAFFGSYDNCYMYFRVDSDPSKEEDNLIYQFEFLTTEQAANGGNWLRPLEIVNIGIPKISAFVDTKFKDTLEQIKEIIKENLGKFIQVFNIEEKIFLQEVKESLKYDDVLEVFVRVNSGGIVLTKSDLVFSTLILNIPEMEQKFIALVDQLNGGGEFDFNIDFIIKTSFVLLDKGAKYDTEKLKDGEFIKKLKEDFDKIESALISTLQFLRTDAKILSKRFLKSDLALIPIIDFIYRQPHQHLSEGQSAHLSQYLYMSFFMRFFAFGPDGKLDKIHKMLNDNLSPTVFPIQEIGKYISEKTKIDYTFSKVMLSDLDLVLNITKDGVSEIPQKRGWSLERDHIFPRAVLEDKGISGELINNVGNLRLIDKIRNILKSDTIPAGNIEFYGSDKKEMKEALLSAINDLTEQNFKTFVTKREELMFNKIKAFLGF